MSECTRVNNAMTPKFPYLHTDATDSITSTANARDKNYKVENNTGGNQIIGQKKQFLSFSVTDSVLLTA